MTLALVSPSSRATPTLCEDPAQIEPIGAVIGKHTQHAPGFQATTMPRVPSARYSVHRSLRAKNETASAAPWRHRTARARCGEICATAAKRSRPRLRLRNARQVPDAPHPAVIGGGRGRDAGPDAGLHSPRDAGLRAEPRARVGVAAASAAVQPLPAARALRDGGADGRAAAAAAPSLIRVPCARLGRAARPDLPVTLCVPPWQEHIPSPLGVLPPLR